VSDVSTAIRLSCGCSATHGQSCPACDGTWAELGITPPAPEPLAAAGLVVDDPWLNPTAALTAPF